MTVRSRALRYSIPVNADARYVPVDASGHARAGYEARQSSLCKTYGDMAIKPYLC